MDVKAVKEEFDQKKAGGIHIYPAYINRIEGLLGSHWHEELEIVYTVKGNHNHYINGEHFVTYPGCVLAVNSHFVHSIVPQIYENDGKDSLAAIIVILGKDFLQANFPEYDEIYFTNDNLTASKELEDIFFKLLAYSTENEVNEPFERLHRNALVTELLYLLCKDRTVKRSDMPNAEGKAVIEKMKEIVSYIEENYAKPLTRSEVADQFYLSQNYFSSYFKKYVGVTFIQYLTNYRLTKAKEELLLSDKSVGRIALECGFSDDRSFIQAFKKWFNETPLQYRKQNMMS